MHPKSGGLQDHLSADHTNPKPGGLRNGDSPGSPTYDPTDGDGTEDAAVSFVCFGSTIDNCCAGRTGSMRFIGVYDFTNPSSPRPIGDTIMPGFSPLGGGLSGEIRRIDELRVDGEAIITEEELVYPESADPTEIGHSPDATIEVTHRFVDGRWTTSARVIG